MFAASRAARCSLQAGIPYLKGDRIMASYSAATTAMQQQDVEGALGVRRERIRMLSDRLLFTRDGGKRDSLREQLHAEICQARMLGAARPPLVLPDAHHLGA